MDENYYFHQAISEHFISTMILKKNICFAFYSRANPFRKGVTYSMHCVHRPTDIKEIAKLIVYGILKYILNQVSRSASIK